MHYGKCCTRVWSRANKAWGAAEYFICPSAIFSVMREWERYFTWFIVAAFLASAALNNSKWALRSTLNWWDCNNSEGSLTFSTAIIFNNKLYQTIYMFLNERWEGRKKEASNLVHIQSMVCTVHVLVYTRKPAIFYRVREEKYGWLARLYAYTCTCF